MYSPPNGRSGTLIPIKR
jgi:hypothetical protein